MDGQCRSRSDHLRLPSLEAVAEWSPQNHVRLVTLAPELPGALPVIEALAERGVLVSSGHSMATYAEAQAAFAAGTRYGTHLFNAMPTLEHREPGLPGALLLAPDQTVGIIPDGVHTHPAMIALASISGAPKISSGRVVPRPSESVLPSSITVPA